MENSFRILLEKYSNKMSITCQNVYIDVWLMLSWPIFRLTICWGINMIFNCLICFIEITPKNIANTIWMLRSTMLYDDDNQWKLGKKKNMECIKRLSLTSFAGIMNYQVAGRKSSSNSFIKLSRDCEAVDRTF